MCSARILRGGVTKGEAGCGRRRRRRRWWWWRGCAAGRTGPVLQRLSQAVGRRCSCRERRKRRLRGRTWQGGRERMHGHGGYDSDFSDDEHCGESSKRKKRTVEDDLLLQKPFQKEKHGKVAHKQVAAELLDREEARNRRFHLIAMDAYQRHTKFVNDYILYYGGKKEDFKRLGENDKTDLDVIRENHRFLWNEEDEMDMTWEKRLAKKYYDKLFKEYCIADLSKYKENKFGFRWRVEKEVISGKGQFFCGNKYCDKKEGLKSWEVNFGYIEHGEKRNALVKLRLCQECSIKLNFHHRRKEIKSKKRKDKTKKDCEESSHKKSRLSSAEEASKKKDKGNSDEEESASESELWKGPLPETDEKSQEEEFDEYFQDLFL
ncbi:FRA10AC1 isoform 5 [Pongo abelii]|uniref:FRA10AC1 isoform 5 n=3 Tax=Pongo abelii TaxID=9601 RepID=A0A2J8Y5B8_PONAB|nr:FRA10AC1 isoform 5 [Pongo abelii]